MKITRMKEMKKGFEMPSKREVAEMNSLRTAGKELNPLRSGRREKFLSRLNIQCRPE